MLAVLRGSSERVSQPNSLITGKIQGIFAETRLARLHEALEKTWLLCFNSLQSKQGIFLEQNREKYTPSDGATRKSLLR